MAVIDLDLNPDRRMLRRFGLVGLVVLGALALLGHLRWGFPEWLTVVLGAVAGLSGLFALLRPRLNLPLYLILTLVFYPVGVVVSYVVLAVLFFGILTPVGLLFRLIGRDAMRRRFEPEATSYWIPRSDRPPLRRYFRPF